MKQQSSQPSKKFSPIRLFLFFIVAAILVVLTWNWYVHYQDKQKFMTLKQDMLSLQTEFNKIDPGWTYSEWCHAKGEKFKENEASSCGITLKNTVREVSAYLDSISVNASLTRDTSYIDDQGLKHDNRSVVFPNNKKMKCEFTSHLHNANSKNAWLSCSDSALDFYFPKTQ